MVIRKIEDSLMSSLVHGDFKITYETPYTQIYTKRWLILGLFLLFGITNSIQYPQYTILANILVDYYHVSHLAIGCTSMSFMVTYLVFSFPGVYILEKFGIRRTVIIGMVATTLGIWIKVISVQQDRFWLALVGQTIAGVAQVLVLPLPPKIAASWFSNDEVATACSIGVAGPQIGTAVGFLISPLFVYNGTTKEIENGLYGNMISTAIFCTLAGTAIFFLFDDAPSKPPSVTQLKALENRSIAKSEFKTSLTNLTSNKSFMLFVIIYGFNVGMFFPFSVFFDSIVLFYYPKASNSDISALGGLGITFFVIGALTGGFLLDKYKAYQSLMLLFIFFNICSLLMFCLSFGCTMWVFQTCISLLGFTCGSVAAIGYEVGVEITYPEPEGISGGLLSCSYQLFAVVLSYSYYLIYNSLSFGAANSTLFGLLVAVDLLLMFIKIDLRRQSIVNSTKYIEF